MERTRRITIRKEMQMNAYGHNRVMSYEVTKHMPLFQLLCNVHPLDRESFARKLNRINKINDSILANFIN